MRKIMYVLMLLCLLSCGQESSMQTSSKEPKINDALKNNNDVEMLDLINTRWVLRELNGINIKPEEISRDIYIRFKDSTAVEGFGGCNQMFGNYTLLSSSTLKIGLLASTRMSCTNDKLEYNFHQVLDAVDSYTTDSKFLYLKSQNKVQAKLEAIYL